MPSKSKKIAPERQLFEVEARPHLDALYSVALRLTRSPVDAEDLVQDTLVRAYRFYARFETGTNFKAWLLRIQMNSFVNRYRRAVRERQVFDGPMAVPVGEGVMSRASMRGLTDPEGDAQRRLIAREIKRAFDDTKKSPMSSAARSAPSCPACIAPVSSFKARCKSMRWSWASSKTTTVTSRNRFRSKHFVRARR